MNLLQVTLWLNVIINSAQVIGSLAPAVLLSQNLWAEGFMRFVIFFPVVIPQSVVTVVWGIMPRPDEGLVNSFLQLVGVVISFSEMKLQWVLGLWPCGSNLGQKSSVL